MSPSGEFHPVEGTHSDWALSQRKSLESLFKAGWMRVTFVGGTLYLHNDFRPPTEKQKRAARDLALESGRLSRVAFDNGSDERDITENAGFRAWLESHSS